MSKLNLRLFLIIAFFLGFPFFVSAATCDQSTIVKVIARDPDGSYIANASVDIYTQTLDADGNKKPGVRLTGGVTSATLGIASLSFKNSTVASAPYAIRIRTISKDSASFWFFDNTLDCGATTTIDKTLSGLRVSLRQSNGSVLTNASFNIYTQIHDTSGSLTNTKNELLGAYNTGNSGQVKLYLPQGSVRGGGGAASDYYVLEINHAGIKYNAYNIAVHDAAITDYDYFLSALRVHLQYESGTNAPGATVEVYTQKVNLDYQKEIDAKVGSFVVGDKGDGSIELAAGIYALRIKVAGVYQYFWDNTVLDGLANQANITLKGSATSASSSAACANASKVYVALTDIAGHGAAALKFEIYEQGVDINGLPLPGLKLVSGTTDASGRATVSLKPDANKNYALKVWDKKADLGEFWYYNVLKFVCDYDRKLTKSLPALKIVLRDAAGKPRYNYNFSLYAQHFDVDGNPTFAATDLIANLKTGNTGQAIVYVSPYNAYSGNQTGYYALSTKDSNNNTKNFYNIIINEANDYTFSPSFNGLSGEFLDASGRVFANKNLDLFEQKSSDGHFSLGQKLFSFRTDAAGKFKFEYSAGTYALAAPDELGKTNVFWNTVIGTNSDSKKFIASLINFNFTGAADKNTSPTLQLYSLVAKNGTYVRGDLVSTIKLKNNHAALSLAAGAYLVTYEGSEKNLFGQTFYAKNGFAYNVNFSTSAKYFISDKTEFTLAGADSNLAVPVPGVTAGNSTISPAATGTLSKRLKGRILLQVQDKGQAWYINPADGHRYSLGRPQDAYSLMRRFALGISNSDFTAIENNPSGWSQLAGRILIKPNDSGRAYYFDPVNLKLYYLGRPDDAYNIMRQRGLGITNSDLTKISDAE